MKKKFIITFLVVLSIVLASCSAPSSKETSKPTEVSTDTKAEKKDDEIVSKTVPSGELLKNNNFRRAVASAIDKSYIEEYLLANGSVASDYFVSKGYAFNDEGKDFREKYPDGFIHFDLEKANEYWNKAKEELGITEAKIVFLTADNEERKKVSEYVQAQLMQNLEGLTVEVDVQPFKNSLAKGNKGDYDITLAGWGPDYADPMTFLDKYVNESMNSSKYFAQDYSDIINSAKTGELSRDSQKRWEALQEAEKIITERDIVVAPLYQVGETYLQRPEVKGIIESLLPPNALYAEATTEILTNGKHIIRIARPNDLPSLDVSKAQDGESFTLFGNIIDGLVEVNAENKVVPRIAKSWDVSDDSTKYTFHLREDALWSNGSKVTANDFVFSWKRLADPNTGSVYNFIVSAAGIKNASEIAKGEKPASDLGVKAIDDYTLEVELVAPIPYFVRLMSFGSFLPINEEFFNERPETFGTSINDILCSGAYVLTSNEAGYGYTIEKNPNYYDKDRVKNDGVSFRIVKDIASGVNLFEAGEVDQCQISGEYAENYMDNPAYKSNLVSTMRYIQFNVNNRK